MTENISRNGMLMQWDTKSGPLGPPEIGELLVVEIELPVNHSFVRKCIHCQATVVRVSASEYGARVALSVNQMQFRDSTSEIPSLADLEVELGSRPM